jgi:hypothetical protein
VSTTSLPDSLIATLPGRYYIDENLFAIEQRRYGWSGGLGTNFFVDPDGTVGVLLTQVEMGGRMQALVNEFHALSDGA